MLTGGGGSSYSFGTIPNSITEGASGTFNVITFNVSTGTVLYWTIQTNSGDISPTSGSFSISNNAGSFNITPIADTLTEGAESFTVAIRTGSISGPVVATSNSVTINDVSYSISPMTGSVNEGSSISFTVTTTNVANGTTLYWVYDSGTAGAGTDFAAYNGSFTITSNLGYFSIGPVADSLTEGSETFSIAIKTGSVYGTSVTNTGTITINDTSLTPTVSISPMTASVNEGSSITFTVNTTSIPSGTTLYWRYNGGSADPGTDFSAYTGSFTITSNIGYFSVGPLADSTTEGSETFSIAVATVSTSGTQVASTGTITIIDTSVTPPAYGTLVYYYCSGYDKWGTYNNGSGGTYNAIVESNSAYCGYVPPPAYGTVISQGCVANGVSPYTYRIVRANGSGGTYNDDTNNSTSCGYVPPPTLSISASGNTTYIIVSWSSTNATTVTWSGYVSGTAPNGSQTFQGGGTEPNGGFKNGSVSITATATGSGGSTSKTLNIGPITGGFYVSA